MISTSVSWRWCGGKWRSKWSIPGAPGAGTQGAEGGSSRAYCSRYVAWFRNGLHGGLKAGRAGVLMHYLTLPVPLVTHLQQLNLHSAVVPHSTCSISLQKGGWTPQSTEVPYLDHGEAENEPIEKVYVTTLVTPMGLASSFNGRISKIMVKKWANFENSINHYKNGLVWCM